MITEYKFRHAQIRRVVVYPEKGHPIVPFDGCVFALGRLIAHLTTLRWQHNGWDGNEAERRISKLRCKLDMNEEEIYWHKQHVEDLGDLDYTYYMDGVDIWGEPLLQA